MNHYPVVRVVEGDGGIVVVTLDRPAARNALSLALLEQLDTALGAAEGARALVVSGSGGSFCAGGDLAEVHEALSEGRDDVVEHMLGLVNSIVRRLRRLPVPTVAAVDGLAVGAGMALALATDLRVVSPTSSLVPGYLAIDATPDGGATYQLARALGPHAALSAFVRNRPIRADELVRRGMAEPAPAGEVLATAIAAAEATAGISPHSLLATRELIDRATTHGLDDHLEAEAEHFRKIWDTPHFRAAIERFGRPAAAPPPTAASDPTHSPTEAAAP